MTVIEKLRETKVGNEGGLGRGDENVVGFDIAVNNAVRMQEADSFDGTFCKVKHVKIRCLLHVFAQRTVHHPLRNQRRQS